MQVIVLASQKGGAGKTTTARHIAVEAERQGEGPVALIDVDPQGGLARWWNRRAAETPVFIACKLARNSREGTGRRVPALCDRHATGCDGYDRRRGEAGRSGHCPGSPKSR